MRLSSALLYAMAMGVDLTEEAPLAPRKSSKKTLDERIKEGRKSPKWEPIPKFKHRQRKRGRK